MSICLSERLGKVKEIVYPFKTRPNKTERFDCNEEHVVTGNPIIKWVCLSESLFTRCWSQTKRTFYQTCVARPLLFKLWACHTSTWCKTTTVYIKMRRRKTRGSKNLHNACQTVTRPSLRSTEIESAEIFRWRFSGTIDSYDSHRKSEKNWIAKNGCGSFRR